ncbi:glutathione hydrolase 1 proenzyme-like [Prorops nasuta]|uniref:glutathione hydrolase 1 proenzyme-like n=1 Tax=Prorops nasuta TaxID=863751 RepID=UPI0034CF672D
MEARDAIVDASLLLGTINQTNRRRPSAFNSIYFPNGREEYNGPRIFYAFSYLYRGKKKVLILCLGLLILVAVAVTVIVVLNHQQETVSVYTKAAVSTNGQECSQVGADILKKNGTAVDAAIAALLCEGIASLHSMGLGGGFFMTIWHAPNKTAYFLDARETAPNAAHKDMFNDTDQSTFGGRAVAVPGEILGYREAWKKFGSLPWAELFQPAIKLCHEGSRINGYLAAYLKQKEALIRASPSLAEILINNATNSTWLENDRIRRPKLAETLTQIANEGPDVFYGKKQRPTLGEKFINDLNDLGGIMTLQDLKEYEVKWREPLTAKMGNLTVISAPPPGSGAILTFIMSVLDGLLPFPNTNIMWQRIVEAFKWGYARRTELADPDFYDISEVLHHLTSSDYISMVRSNIKDNATSNNASEYGAVMVNREDHGTAHVSVLAPDGSAVSVTSTINQVFGAMIRSKSTGIIYNDEMDDFSSPNMTNSFDLPPSKANFIKPKKRPFSSMAPTIVIDEKKQVRLVIGAAGGSKITTAVAVGMILHLWEGYNIKKAVDAPRIHHQLLPMTVQNEKGFDKQVLNYLTKIGHNVTTFSGIGSAITAVANNSGHITANSDYRRQGTVAGL